MAGASMKDIKLRIRSVESTMQITKAMQLVATSKLRRAKERMEKSKPFTEISEQAVASAIASCEDKSHPYLDVRPLKQRCYIIIAGERGLAGGYNNNVFKAVAEHAGNTPYCVLPIGRKAIDKYQRLGVECLTENYPRVESLSVSECFHLSSRLTENYLKDQYQEVWIVYTNFINMMSSEVQVKQLLPVTAEKDAKRVVSTVYDPDPATVLEKIMPDYLAGRLYSALCDSFASEVSARRNAMDSATKNAGEMISSLTLKYNRARQGSITQEITEIVAGA